MVVGDKLTGALGELEILEVVETVQWLYDAMTGKELPPRPKLPDWLTQLEAELEVEESGPDWIPTEARRLGVVETVLGPLGAVQFPRQPQSPQEELEGEEAP